MHSDARRIRRRFPSIVSLWIRGSVLVPIFHFAYAHHPHVRTFEFMLDNSTERRMSSLSGSSACLSIGKKAPQVGHGTTATTGPRSASPFTENPPRLKQGAYHLQGSAAENLLTTVSEPTNERKPRKKQRNRVASTVVDRSNSKPLWICPSETFLHSIAIRGPELLRLAFISAHPSPASAQRGV